MPFYQSSNLVTSSWFIGAQNCLSLSLSAISTHGSKKNERSVGDSDQEADHQFGWFVRVYYYYYSLSIVIYFYLFIFIFIYCYFVLLLSLLWSLLLLSLLLIIANFQWYPHYIPMISPWRVLKVRRKNLQLPRFRVFSKPQLPPLYMSWFVPTTRFPDSHGKMGTKSGRTSHWITTKSP